MRWLKNSSTGRVKQNFNFKLSIWATIWRVDFLNEKTLGHMTEDVLSVIFVLRRKARGYIAL